MKNCDLNNNGKPCEKVFQLKNDKLEVGVSDCGACIRYIRLQTPQGSQDVCLTFESTDERLSSGTRCGAFIGRVANRIANASFNLNGQTYNLIANNGTNTLHSGLDGFDTRFFDVSEQKDALVMCLTSPDGDQGFPGTLNLTVIFRLDGNSLCVEMSAVSDKDTVWAPTMHPYFNLHWGHNVLDTVLQIYADKYTPMDDRQIPTGEMLDVSGTVFDFRQPKEIGRDFDLSNLELCVPHGYDHNYVLTGEHAATAYSKASGIQMDVFTDLPGIHFYSGNFLKGFNGLIEYKPLDGFALEPQYFPNAINQPNFVQPILTAGMTKKHYIKYTFSMLDK